jgi:hypothetical protein
MALSLGGEVCVTVSEAGWMLMSTFLDSLIFHRIIDENKTKQIKNNQQGHLAECPNSSSKSLVEHISIETIFEDAVHISVGTRMSPQSGFYAGQWYSSEIIPGLYGEQSSAYPSCRLQLVWVHSENWATTPFTFTSILTSFLCFTLNLTMLALGSHCGISALDFPSGLSAALVSVAWSIQRIHGLSLHIALQNCEKEVFVTLSMA